MPGKSGSLQTPRQPLGTSGTDSLAVCSSRTGWQASAGLSYTFDLITATYPAGTEVAWNGSPLACASNRY